MSKGRAIIIFFTIVTIVAVTFFGFNKYRQPQQSKTFHAVFLSNDQVYFGKVAEDTETNLTLTDVYYLKASTDTTAIKNLTKENSATAKLALVKLGEELHAPKDKIAINKEHILFTEEMESNGTIMDAIRRYEQKISQ